MAFAYNSFVINSLRVKQGEWVWLCASNHVAVSILVRLMCGGIVMIEDIVKGMEKEACRTVVD